jgi:outer membrane lipoprotein-sorting protein
MRFLLTFAYAAFLASLASTSPSASDDVFARSRTMYASLKSYADTGTIVSEYGSAASPSVERHAFKTYYRAPRHYYFEFNEDKKAGADRSVIWSDDDAFYTWWSVTGVETAYPRGRGASALVSSPYARMIAPLLFSRAGLQGSLTEVSATSDAGIEQVGGRRCHKRTGVAQSVYGATGHVTNVRRITIWIDVDTLLVRKIFEDTPRGTPAGTALRYTITFEPQANPALDDSRFRFTAPATQH